MKKALLEYTDVQVEVEDLQRRIEKIEENMDVVTDKVRGSSKNFPYTQHNVVIRGIEEEQVKKIKKLREILRKEYDRLLEKQIAVEEKIAKIEDSRIRTIIRLKFIDKESWTQIAHRFCTTMDSIKKEYYRYINKL